MANYVITTGTNSFTFEIDGSKAEFLSGDIKPFIPANGGGRVLKLRDVNHLFNSVGIVEKEIVKIDLDTDTVNVDGVTVFADADTLYSAIVAVFFLASSSGGSAIPANQTVGTFAELPDPIASDGQYWIVDTSTGTWILGTRRESGVYKAVLGEWKFRGADVPYYLQDDQFTIKDSGDSTKQLGFEVGSISSGQRRVLTAIDKNYTVGEDRETVKLIQTVSDLLRLHTPNGSNEIDLTFPIYEIDSEALDLGVYKLTANRNVTIKGISQGNNKLLSTEDNTDLISVTNGNLFVQNLALESSGTNSQCIVMNGTSSESLDLFYVQFDGSSKWGTLTNIRQGFWTNGFSINAVEGFTLSGSMSGFTLVDTRIINCGGFILGEGQNLTLDSIRSNVNATIALGDFAFSFDYNNFNSDGGYQIEGGKFNGSGAMLSPFTDVNRDADDAERSTRSAMIGNTGSISRNTRAGTGYSISASTVTPLTFNVPARLLGTATFAKQEHFGNQLDNVITYLNTVSGEFTPFYSILLEGGGNDIIRVDIRKYADLSTTVDFEILASLRRIIPNSQGGFDPALFVIPVPDITLNFEERLEIWVTNETDGTDVEMIEGSTAYIARS